MVQAQAAATAAAATPREASKTAEPAPAGVQASFSPQGLWIAAQQAHDTGAQAKATIVGLGQLGSEALDEVGAVLDQVRDGADALVDTVVDGVKTGADLLGDGLDALHDAATAPLKSLQNSVTESAELLGDAVQSTVAYAALTALAGGLLVNELA